VASSEKSGGGGEASFERRLSFISLIVSLLAVVLSQFHPLYTFLDKPKLGGSVNPDFSITHQYGSLSLTLYLHLTNNGRATGTVTRVETLIEKADDSGYRKRMPVQTYFTPLPTYTVGEAQNPLPFGARDIVPDARWENYVNAYEMPTKDEQTHMNSLIMQVQKQLNDQIRAPHSDKPNYFPNEPYRIDDKLYDELTSTVRKNLGGFGMGEYTLLLMLWDDKAEKPFSVSCYSFSVFEADIQILEGIVEQYRTGNGVIYPLNAQLPMGFGSTLRPVKDQGTIDRMLRDFGQL
jgi:hypothetical protein